MSNETNKGILQLADAVNVEKLLAELEAYRWRDRKATIIKELNLSSYLSKWRRDEIINAYETNHPFTLIELLDISKEADNLIIKGYATDEIIKAVREWVQERLDEIKKEKGEENE